MKTTQMKRTDDQKRRIHLLLWDFSRKNQEIEEVFVLEYQETVGFLRREGRAFFREYFRQRECLNKSQRHLFIVLGKRTLWHVVQYNFEK